MLIPAITNLEILDKEPSQYFAALAESNNDIDEILKHHYIQNISESGIPENDFMSSCLIELSSLWKLLESKQALLLNCKHILP